MIERDGGNIVFHCDECPEVRETGESDFNTAWQSAKRDGWRSFKKGSEWLHSCPSCVEDFARNNNS